MTAKRELEKIINAVKKAKGSRPAAAKALNMAETTLRRRLEEAADKKMKVPPNIDPKDVVQSNTIPDAELHAAWNVYERYGYNLTEAADAVGLRRNAMDDRIRKAMTKFGYTKKNLGSTHAMSAKKLALPKKGEVRRYLLTCAQNNTQLHEPTWASLINLSNYYGADIKISTFTYIGSQDGSEKRGREKKDSMGWKIEDRWYDPRVVPFISDDFEQLAPGLVWCGHYNTRPTSSDPLRSKENLNGRNSGVFPHTRVEMRPVATTQGDGTKFNFTTGAVTLRNYIQRDAGITAEFYHCFGALLVEVDADGNWWPRQLNADSDGTIYDIDVYSTPDGVFVNDEESAAVSFGDIHRRNIAPEIMEATWGKGGLVEVLAPQKQVFHDLLDFESRSHHNRKDPHVMYALYKRGRDNVLDEVREAGEFLDFAQEAYAGSTCYVIDSNHDRHFDRYLKEVRDPYSDMPNARLICEANLAIMDAIDEGREDEFTLLEWVWQKLGVATEAKVMNLRSEDPDKLSLVVCEGAGGGVELALHGDIGPNGARGSPRNLSKLGRKNVIGHGHSPGIWGGTYVAGVTGKLRQGYNTGPSSWAHAHVVTYPNGKRQVILFWKARPWAARPGA